MSDKKIEDPKPTEPEKPTPAPQLSNIELFNLKKKLKEEVVEETDKVIESKDKKVDAFLKEAIEARKINAPPYILNIIESLDPESQLVVLKAHAEKNADPNISTLGVPIGKEKHPLEEYMIYNVNKDTINYSIPASVLMDPKKNKKLLGIE